LTQPNILPSGKRIPGLKLDHPRQLALMHALVCFAHIAAGNTFTTAELYPYVLAALHTRVRADSRPAFPNLLGRRAGSRQTFAPNRTLLSGNNLNPTASKWKSARGSGRETIG
jgi:hypothetical protein